MRLHNEQSGSSSLYTHPYALEAVPLQDDLTEPLSVTVAVVAKPKHPSKDAPRDVLEQRLADALAQINQVPSKPRPDNQTIADHLSLVNRWYHRPEAKRTGEAVFYDPEKAVPAKRVLRAISRTFREKVMAAPATSGVNSVKVPGEAQ
jgi:excinuclease ABC subunit C